MSRVCLSHVPLPSPLLPFLLCLPSKSGIMMHMFHSWI
ncbi:hypothetical protein SLEP1_g28595 [Rubroshorea leprosula]|uniref:Uncharacterized protein n=1 Tax=Rubroshorea leprosula TaxID=152421 RepID=A0AAV5JU47_9ROSI|nr:hypothetical protein SLEP1_g28595 [Rubroshorea leprosula]